MRTRIQKELRLLLVPAGGVVTATILAASLLMARQLFVGQALIGRQLAQLAFVLGVPLIAASSFGSEFEHRTLPLLLAQPVARRRIWLEKWLTLVGIVGAIVTLQLVLSRLDGWPGSPFAPAAFVGIIVCSAPLWTLVTGSTIGGLAFAGSLMMALELAMTYLHYRVTGTWPAKEVFAPVETFTAVRGAYAALTLAAGWLVFARFQAAAPTAEGHGGARARTVAALRPRPRGALANLVRKELILQRMTVLVAGAFTASWFIATAIVAPQSHPAGVADVVFPMLLLVYIPVAVVLAGTLSNSEERSLGIHGWHLVLPVPRAAQWRIKLAATLGMALLLAVALPAAVTSLTAPLLPNGHASVVLLKWTFFLWVTMAVMVMFWASTVFGHTVRAAVAAGVLLFIWAIGSVIAAVPLGLFVGRHLPDVVPYFAGVRIPAVSVNFVLNGVVTTFVLVVLAPTVWQSRVAFEQLELSRTTIVRMLLVVLGVAWLATFLIFASSTLLRLA